MNDPYKYPGNELDLFKEAITWKKYFAKKIRPFIQGAVLEVGAGIGATTQVLNNGLFDSWIMLEPDDRLYNNLDHNRSYFPSNVTITKGQTGDLNQKFDTILYIDVLEHIEDDAAELLTASSCLNDKGHLIVLSPAFHFLYAEFDKSIGHYRRYRKRDFKKLTPPGLRLVSCHYLDSCGFFASLMNRFFLHQSYPSRTQIHFWDKYLVPISRIADSIFLYSFGRSILAIWEKP